MPLQPAVFRLAFALHSLACLLLLTPTGAEAGTFNPDRAIGYVVPPWTGLVGTDGREHGWEELADHEAVVVIEVVDPTHPAFDIAELDLATHRRK